MAFTPYCGAAPAPGEWLSRWNGDPLLLAAFALAAAAWLARGDRAHDRAFWAGFGILALLFVSPFCALTSALFSARSLHHLLLVAVAAPLLAYALPSRLRLPLGAATIVHALVFWLWHLPAAYAAALSSDLLYWVMQASLLGTALLFWQAVFRVSDRGPAAVAALIGTMAQMGLLGAIITFAPAPLYAPHLLTTAPWGLSPLDDQQLAGMAMWVVSLPIYLAAALAVAARRLGPAPA